MNDTLFYSTIMIAAGLGIPIMAALNGGLGMRLESPALAATILLCVGLVVSVVYLLLTEGVPVLSASTNIPWMFYGGGLFVMFYILSISWVAPRFGISNAISFVLLGQLIAMSVIDHFGLIDAQQYKLTVQRVLGLLLMAAGVMLVVNKNASV